MPFLVAREGKINNDADVRASVGASNPDGRFRLGKNVIFADGTNLIGDTVQIGNGSSVYRVLANTLLRVTSSPSAGEHGHADAAAGRSRSAPFPPSRAAAPT